MPDSGVTPPPVQPQPPPQNVVQATGRIAEDVVGALKGQPILMLIALTQIAFVAAASWYLHNQLMFQNEQSLTLLRGCLSISNRGSGP